MGRRDGLRGTLERWLAARDVRRHGLPASAIVLVRTMRASWAEVAGPIHPLRDDALGEVLRRALRPALERGAIGLAPAVWFADESELLACMARDVIAGPLSARWWWPALLHGDSDRAAVMRYWIASARSVPRAVERLQSMDLGEAWFVSWNTPARHGLLAALVGQYPVSPAVGRFVDAGPETSSAAGRRVPADPAERNGSLGGASIGEGSMDRHAENGDAPSPATTVTPAPIRLLQLCLSLARDPGCAFDERYVERALRREPRSAGQKQPFDGTAAPAANRRPPMTTQRATDGGAPGPPRSGSPNPTTGGAPDEEVQVGRGAHLAQTPASRLQGGATAPGVQPGGPVRDAVALESAAAAATTYSGPPVAAESGAGVPSTAFDHDTRFETGHGGLFFVLNAALQLGLYGDFSQPLHRGLEMSPWRFLHEIGAAVGGRRFVRDPLAAWLERFQNPDPEPATSDSVVEPASPGLATGALAHLAPSGRRLRKVAPGVASTALAGVLPQLRARLVLALGLRDPRRLAGTLLRVPAEVRVGGERIDVCFALQHLPISVRLAGLDRDPGWVPAAGRDLRFHFE